MKSANLSRLKTLESASPDHTIYGDAIIVDGKWKVKGWNDNSLDGLYSEAEYNLLVARADVLIVFITVRARVE